MRTLAPGGWPFATREAGRGAIPAALLGAAALLATVAAAPAPAAAGGFYRYIDDQGVVHFTNQPPADRRFRRVNVTPRGVRTGRVVRPGGPPAYDGYDDLILRTARAYGVQPALVKAVIAAESNFDAGAVSHKGAMGLMQLMPGTARDLGVEEPFEPSQNVLGGVRYLRDMLSRYGDVSRALAAYNAGPRAVDRYAGVPPYRETRTYVERVLHYYSRYDRDFR